MAAQSGERLFWAQGEIAEQALERKEQLASAASPEEVRVSWLAFPLGRTSNAAKQRKPSLSFGREGQNMALEVSGGGEGREQDVVGDRGGAGAFFFPPLQGKNKLKNGHGTQKKGCHGNKSLRPGTSDTLSGPQRGRDRIWAPRDQPGKPSKLAPTSQIPHRL